MSDKSPNPITKSYLLKSDLKKTIKMKLLRQDQIELLNWVLLKKITLPIVQLS